MNKLLTIYSNDNKNPSTDQVSVKQDQYLHLLLTQNLHQNPKAAIPQSCLVHFDSYVLVKNNVKRENKFMHTIRRFLANYISWIRIHIQARSYL